MMELYDHQRKIVEMNPLKCGLFWEAGAGKSLASISLIEKNNIKNCLVVTPKSIRDQFENETKTFSKGITNFIVVTKEKFKKNWTDFVYCDGCIIDEAHAHSGFVSKKKQSQLFKATLSFITKATPKCLYLMTATPYRSSPMSIYALSLLLGRNWDYSLFKDTFFSEVNMGMRWPVPVVKKGIEKQIGVLVNRLGYTAKLQDLFDVPEQTFLVERFSLTRSQKIAIEELEDTSAIARFTKIHCIENGVLKSDGYTDDKYFDCEKTERVLELCDEHKKIAVVSRYNLQNKLYKELLEKRGKKVFVINGELEDKYSTVEEINKTEECIVLIQSDTCAGYNMWSVPVMVFASYSWSLVSYIQLIGRILRSNHLKKNLYISLVQDNKSVDYRVYDNIVNKKQDFHVEIFKT